VYVGSGRMVGISSHVYVYRCKKQLSEQLMVIVAVLRQKLACTKVQH